MPRDIEGLKRSTCQRSQTTMERAQAAIHRMHAAEMEINFRSVAEEAKVSTAWLYKTKPLRDRIMKLRRVPATPAENDARTRRHLSLERMIATLRLRINVLEEKNRDLAEQLEIAYGKLTATGESNNLARRLHVNDVQKGTNNKKSLDHYR
jgi:hypothetical protein